MKQTQFLIFASDDIFCAVIVKWRKPLEFLQQVANFLEFLQHLAKLF